MLEEAFSILGSANESVVRQSECADKRPFRRT